ncbi:MAG: PD-(D/E)XK nuclease family protein, partial [Clostridia bacterium]|nr:PD-(D/E)XK nuclease family protein [Clostridia bacterium]
LVPEQFSFESERRLLRQLGAAAASSVKVYSFTRLADMILRETGDIAGRRMDDSTRALLVSQALTQTESVRSVPRYGFDGGQVSLVAQMLSELKQCALTAADVREQAERETGRLRDKLNDLAVITEAYDALVQQTYVDPQDTLTRAARHLPESAVGAGAHIFVDGFTGFTAQELNLLRELMPRAAGMTVALCTDSLDDRDEFSLFAIPTETAQTLMRIARDQGVPIRPPVYLTDDHRYRAAGLRTLQSELFRPDAQPLSEPAPEVTVTACADVYGECEAVTRTVRRLLREGTRCRDIAVVARDLSPYRGLLDVSLRRAGIPNYFDAGEDILTDSLTETVLAAIRTVTEGWQTESLLRLLKTGLLGFSSHSISLLEDYAYLWDLSGGAWRRPWTKSPEGFSDRRDDAGDEKKLVYLNLLRRRLMSPLERLYIRLRESLCARDFALAVYDYLQDISAARMTRLRVRQFDAMGETALADRTERLWDVMMELLSVFGEVGPASPRPARELSRLLQTVAGEIRLGSIPQSLDAVQIGAADRIRMSAPKVVFVLGANEGVFPGVPPTGGYFTEQERRRLLDEQMPLSGGAEWQSNQERLFAYAAVTAPSERLYVSYECGDVRGEPLLPSTLVHAIEAVLPMCATVSESAWDGQNAETPEEAMNRVAETYRRPSEVSATLSAALRCQSGYADKIDALRRSAERPPWQIHDTETAKRLFGNRMKISYTAVDNYYECPFRYFCRYGLRVSPLRRAELNALEFGVAVHYLMQNVLPLYIERGVQTVTREQVRQDACEWVDRYVAEQMGG